MKILIFTLTFLLLNFNAFAGSILLQGIFAPVLNISITPQSVASSLDLTTTQNNLIVASVTEQSNSKTGYTVTISTVNHGNLKRVGGTNTVAYTMKYNGSSIAVGSTTGTTFVNTSMFLANANKNLTISYTGTPSITLTEGTYTDTVNLTISAI